ncbi:MAG: substrate-binding domain-containing protein [Spirochaetota bacterium]|nr:MAG: substrate-binding domain-containing protein [Spirochaetota bacterium]
MKRIGVVLFLLLFIGILALLPVTGLAGDKVLRMATTTSTDNTGLLDYLAPVFQNDTGIELQWVAVGTGKALALSRNCDVDILMVHAPNAELQFIKEGYGTDRHEIMYNDFIIIGPKNDPASIKGKTVDEALSQISRKRALFASRGDDSGTNKKEISLWKDSGLSLPDRESWYIQTGQGMLATITIAEERDVYTLTDRGTYIKYEVNKEGNPPLVIIVEGDERLKNQYSVIAVNPDSCPLVEYGYAVKFIEWITSDKTQKLIGDFTMLGKKLFIANAGMSH